jgi:hypothetical protein
MLKGEGVSFKTNLHCKWEGLSVLRSIQFQQFFGGFVVFWPVEFIKDAVNFTITVKW